MRRQTAPKGDASCVLRWFANRKLRISKRFVKYTPKTQELRYASPGSGTRMFLKGEKTSHKDESSTPATDA